MKRRQRRTSDAVVEGRPTLTVSDRERLVEALAELLLADLNRYPDEPPETNSLTPTPEAE